MKLAARGWVVAASIAVLVGCAGTKLGRRADSIGVVIDKARKNGAVRCAPVELAMAESHRDFALQELDEGDYYRAKEELRVAEENAKSAFKKSPPHICARPDVKPAPGDRDGDGIVDDVDRCPDDPEDKDGFRDDDGCPDDDNDNDGIADANDKCPNEPEDKDEFEDDDGCPDDDNDGDGLSDAVDQCPTEPEDKDGFEDDDGCPDCDHDKDGVPECPEAIDKCPDKPAKTPDGCPQKFKNIVVTKDKIELKQTIFFATGKAIIRKRSYRLLGEVATALKDRPKMEVRIEGHTDSRGRDRYNLKLSKARAAAVREHLIGQGVPPERMVSEGYGETRPIADNRTAAGRAQNRRVEFVITKQ